MDRIAKMQLESGEWIGATLVLTGECLDILEDLSPEARSELETKGHDIDKAIEGCRTYSDYSNIPRS